MRNPTSAMSSHFWLWGHTKQKNVLCQQNFETQPYHVRRAKEYPHFFGTTINGKNVKT